MSVPGGYADAARGRDLQMVEQRGDDSLVRAILDEVPASGTRLTAAWGGTSQPKLLQDRGRECSVLHPAGDADRLVAEVALEAILPAW